LKAGAFDLIVVDWINGWDRCGPRSRTPPLKNVKDGAPELQTVATSVPTALKKIMEHASLEVSSSSSRNKSDIYYMEP
jgi:hypothetical protein